MIPRYSRPAMVAIWEPQTRFKIWFEIEAHACDALAELGVIPKASARAIWEKAGDVTFDVERIDVGEQNVAGALQLYGEAGVENVGTRHALMDEARIGADEFGQMGQERDDVMLGDALDFVDALDVEGHVARLRPDRLGALLGDDAELGKRVAGMRLDLEPDAEARLRLPDPNHFGAGISGDHGKHSDGFAHGLYERVPGVEG